MVPPTMSVSQVPIFPHSYQPSVLSNLISACLISGNHSLSFIFHFFVSMSKVELLFMCLKAIYLYYLFSDLLKSCPHFPFMYVHGPFLDNLQNFCMEEIGICTWIYFWTFFFTTDLFIHQYHILTKQIHSFQLISCRDGPSSLLLLFRIVPVVYFSTQTLESVCLILSKIKIRILFKLGLC